MAEREALLEFFEVTEGRWWSVNWNWGSTESRISQWFGIKIDAGGHVNTLDLHENALRGSLSSITRLKFLKNLTILCLSRNNLTLSIPSSFAALQCLQHLDLSWNQLSGEAAHMVLDHGDIL
jgi:hypothetical protein